MQVAFKNPEDQADLAKLHPRAWQVLDFMVEYARVVLKQAITITSIVRKDGTTHDQLPPYRFFDARIFRDLPITESEKMRTVVNLVFPYGNKHDGTPGETIVKLDHSDTSPTATAPHFHVQVRA